jgi:hypothetical protein
MRSTPHRGPVRVAEPNRQIHLGLEDRCCVFEELSRDFPFLMALAFSAHTTWRDCASCSSPTWGLSGPATSPAPATGPARGPSKTSLERSCISCARGNRRSPSFPVGRRQRSRPDSPCAGRRHRSTHAGPSRGGALLLVVGCRGAGPAGRLPGALPKPTASGRPASLPSTCATCATGSAPPTRPVARR